MNGKETIWNSQESAGKRTGGLPPQDSLLALYEKTIYQNDRNGFCIFKMTSEDEAIPQEARDGYCKDDKIHFSVKGYYLPAVSDVMLQMVGKWEKNKYVMLQRALIYTAITRAKKKVILVGQKRALFTAVHRNHAIERNTVLAERLREEFKKVEAKKGKKAIKGKVAEAEQLTL